MMDYTKARIKFVFINVKFDEIYHLRYFIINGVLIKQFSLFTLP